MTGLKLHWPQMAQISLLSRRRLTQINPLRAADGADFIFTRRRLTPICYSWAAQQIACDVVPSCLRDFVALLAGRTASPMQTTDIV